MGFTLPSFWRASTPPTTSQLNEQRALDATATLELEGAQAPQSKTISSGSISPTAAYVIVDTEGGASSDDLTAISPVLSASENLHDGMVIYLKAADSGRVVTVKNSTSANGINTYDGNDYALSATHWLKLQLRSGKWYEVEGRAMETALAAVVAAANAATAAGHAQTKSGTSSTASGTAAKVVTCAGFELSTNARIFVTFSNANTVADAITINVNGTGAKSVYNQTGIVSASNTALFAANQPIEFRYDGTGWVFYDAAKAVTSGATLLASSSTAAATADKVATCTGFTLFNGARVFVTFSNANTVAGALTLNVNATGAKAVYDESGQAVSTTYPAYFPAGCKIEFVYDGTNWVYINRVVKSYASNSTKYRIWANGFIEQWVAMPDNAQAAGTITLPLAFKDTSYNVLVSIATTASYYGSAVDAAYNSVYLKTTTGFAYYSSSANSGGSLNKNYYASGY